MKNIRNGILILLSCLGLLPVADNAVLSQNGRRRSGYDKGGRAFDLHHRRHNPGGENSLIV